MNPHLFRQRLLELAAEYEGLHAGRTRPPLSRLRPRVSLESDASSLDHALGSPRPPTRPCEGEPARPAARGPLPAGGGGESPPAVGAGGDPAAASGDGEGFPAHGRYSSHSENFVAADRVDYSRQSTPTTEGDGAPQRAGDRGDGRKSSESHQRVSFARVSQQAREDTETASRPGRVSFSFPTSLTQMRARPRLAGLHRWSAPRSSSGAAARISEGSSRHSSIAEHGSVASASLSVKGERQFRAAVRVTRGSMRRSVNEGTVPNNDRLIASIVKGRTFSIGIACLIVVSTVMIGIETQLLASLSERGPGSETWITALSITNYALTFLFTVEMVLRLYVFRLDFFLHERVWNLFDVLILLLALGEVALEVTMYAVSDRDISLSDHGGSSKVLRLVRLTRLLRLVRTFRQLKPLRLLLHSLYCAGKSVFWALLLLFTIVYSFGVILTQAVTEHTDAGTRVEDEFLISYYGNLYRSMLSLWWAVSGGISWYELTDPLERTGNAVWSLLFLAYIAFVYFFILNVVTGVFCQNAIEGAQQDLELTIESQLREKQVYADRLRMLFEEMNRNPSGPSGGLSPAEIQYQLAKPKVQSWFKALDVDAKQAWKLFKILDAGNTGRVSLEDFVEGCLKLRGPATRVDVESLKWEIREANGLLKSTAELLAHFGGGLEPGRRRPSSAEGGESESDKS